MSLILGIWYTNDYLNNLNNSELHQSINKTYDIIYCNNTKILNSTEKDRYIRFRTDEILNEEWNICYEPDCDQLCRNEEILSEIYDLRGDKPSCLCTYRNVKK